MCDKLPDNIKRIDVLKIERGMKKHCQCFNPNFRIDYLNKLVYCKDCGAIVDAFEALYSIACHYERLEEDVKSLLNQRKEIMNYKPHMVVFRSLEENYRKTKNGKMLPCCPQCGQLFKFEDITGWANEKFFTVKSEIEE